MFIRLLRAPAKRKHLATGGFPATFVTNWVREFTFSAMPCGPGLGRPMTREVTLRQWIAATLPPGPWRFRILDMQ